MIIKLHSNLDRYKREELESLLGIIETTIRKMTPQDYPRFRDYNFFDVKYAIEKELERRRDDEALEAYKQKINSGTDI